MIKRGIPNLSDIIDQEEENRTKTDQTTSFQPEGNVNMNENNEDMREKDEDMNEKDEDMREKNEDMKENKEKNDF